MKIVVSLVVGGAAGLGVGLGMDDVGLDIIPSINLGLAVAYTWYKIMLGVFD